MKKIVKTIMTLAFVVLAVPAYAQINVDVSNTATVTAEAKDTLDSSVNSDTQAGVNVGSSTVDANVGVEAQSGIMVEDQDDENEEAGGSEADSDSKTSSRTKATIKIGGKLIDLNTDMEIKSSSKVDGDDDLAVFARTSTESDSKISKIESSNKEVEVQYNEKVKLFGFIETNMKRTAKVTFDANADAKVKVSKPWWAVFASGDVTSNATLEGDIKNNLSASANATAEATARVQAEVMASINASMKARLAIK